VTIEQRVVSNIRENYSWCELAEPYVPFGHRLTYWADFLSSRDPDQLVLIDRPHPGALRYRSPQMLLDRKVEALRACNPSNLEKQVVIIAGIELPPLLLQVVPEAREASKYFILSDADTSIIDKYSTRRDAFRKNEGDLNFREYIDLIVKVMPEGETKSFLSDFLRNGNTS